MKQLLLLAAFVFAATPLFAQNTFNSTQTGDGNVIAGVDGAPAATQTGQNEATVEQVSGLNRNGGPTGGHRAYIEQIGGTGADGANQINLYQSFGTNALGNAGAHTAILRQDGSGNLIGGYVDGEVTADSPAEQNTRSNRTADVLQLGDRNSASFGNGETDIDQVGDDNIAVTTNRTTVQYQEGDRNQAYNFGNNATQTQIGNDNYAESSGWVSGGVTLQEQTGDSNTSKLIRLRGGGATTGTTVQIGDDNEVYGYYNGTSNGGNGSDLTATQIGNSNFAEVEFLSKDNLATVSQTGDNNTATITQQ